MHEAQAAWGACPAKVPLPYFGCNIATSGSKTSSGSRSVEQRIVSVPMLDDIASDINGAHSVEDGPVLETRAAPVFEKADPPAPELKDAPSLDLKLQRADAFFASPEDEDGVSSADEPVASRKPVTDADAQSSFGDDFIPADRASSAGRRILRSGACAIAVAGLCGLAWAAGAHQSRGRSQDIASRGPELQQSAQRDELAGAVRQMGVELRALEARVDAQGNARVDVKDAATKALSSPVQPTTGKAVAALAGRLDDVDARLTAKLAQVDEQLAGLERHGPAVRMTQVARAQPPRHRAKRVHDAFDPSREPGAPGAPRPLGSR